MKKVNFLVSILLSLCLSGVVNADNTNVLNTGAYGTGYGTGIGVAGDSKSSVSIITESNYQAPKSRAAGTIGLPIPLTSNVNKFVPNGSGMAQNASPVANYLQSVCNTIYYGNNQIPNPLDYESDYTTLTATSYLDEVDGYINFDTKPATLHQVEILYNFFADMKRKSPDTKYQCLKSAGIKTVKADSLTVNQLTNDALKMLNEQYPKHRNVTLVMEVNGMTFFEDVTSDGTSLSGGLSVGSNLGTNPFGGLAVAYANNNTVNGATYKFGTTVYFLVDVTGTGDDVQGHFIPAEVQKTSAIIEEQTLAAKVMAEKAKILAKQEVDQMNNAVKAAGSNSAR